VQQSTYFILYGTANTFAPLIIILLKITYLHMVYKVSRLVANDLWLLCGAHFVATALKGKPVLLSTVFLKKAA
jgi:hypothetical protein